MSDKHPYVSEDHEGNPKFEWAVALLVLCAAFLAFFGYLTAATLLFALTAIVAGIVRLILGHRSPWKIRSIAFDVVVSIGLGVGLLITYGSILLMM